jgi:hypothetical protein
MDEIIHLPFIIEIDLCDLHNASSARTRRELRAEQSLHSFRAVCHLIAEVMRVFVDGEDRAEIEEEAQSPGHSTDEHDGSL